MPAARRPSSDGRPAGSGSRRSSTAKRAPAMRRSSSSASTRFSSCCGAGFAAGGKRLRPARQVFPAGRLLTGFQLGDPLAGMGHASPVLGGPLRHRPMHGFDGPAVLALEGVDQIQALFSLFQAARVEFDLFQVILQVARSARTRISSGGLRLVAGLRWPGRSG